MTEEQEAALAQEGKMPGGHQGVGTTEPGEDGPVEEKDQDSDEGKPDEVPGEWPSGTKEDQEGKQVLTEEG